MLKFKIAAVISLAAAVLLAFFAIVYVAVHIRYARTRRHRPQRLGRRVKRSQFKPRLLILLLVLALLCTTGAALDYRVLSETPEAPDSEAGQNTPAPEELPQTEPYKFDVAEPVRSTKELFPDYFRLSQVSDSDMLALFDGIANGEITAGNLDPAGEQLRFWLEQHAYPAAFFRYHSDLARLFPEGGVIYEFTDVQNLEDCLAQIRGTKGRLSRHLSAGSGVLIAEDCHRLVIRGLDALYYGDRSGASDEMMWVFAEITFSSLVNESIYRTLTGSDLSDWYYRMAQLYDYLGNLADTDALKVRMYFVSAVCYRLAYSQVRSRGFVPEANSYDSKVPGAYTKMLYQMALYADAEAREGFFRDIWQAHHSPDLPEPIRAQLQSSLVNYPLYQEWRRYYEE